MSAGPVRTAAAAYRVIARLYPAGLRRAYGREMEEAFLDQAQEAHRRSGAPGLVGLLVRTAGGALGARWSEEGGSNRNARGGGTMGWTTEGRHAARSLGRSPGFTVVTVATLALGVGAFSAVFGGVGQVLARPMPYDRSEDLHWVWRDYWGTFPRGWLGGPDIVRLRAHDDVLAGMIAFRNGRANLSDASGSEPQDVRVTLASPGFFEMIGVAPRVGPGFTPAAHETDARSEAVLGHALWQSAFGGDPSVIGRDVFLDGEPYAVVGILPEDFDFVVHSSLGEPRPADLYVPLQTDLAALSAGNGSFAGLIRVRPGVTDAAVDAALAQVAGELDTEFFDERGFRLWKVGMREDLVAEARAPLLALLAASAILLLILGANLAALFLARAHRKTHDAAVRAAMGAGRRALLRTAAAEGVVVAGLGLAGGLLLALWGSDVLAAAARGTLPRAAELGFDPLTAAGACAAVLLLAGLSMTGPALRLSRTGPAASIRAGAGRMAAGGGRARGALVVAQLALAVTLVVGAGLLARSFAALLAEDPGFDVGSTLTARADFEGPAYPDSASVVDAQRRLLERVAALPGVQVAGLTNALPLGLETNQSRASFPGAPGALPGDDGDGELVDLFSVTPGYVEAVGIRVLEGRSLTLEDEQAPIGVLIDDVLAARYFPAVSPLGATIVAYGDTSRIVGVVDHARFYDVFRDDRGQVYVPRAYAPTSEARLAVRTAGDDPMGALPGVRAALREVDPSLPLSEARALDAVVAEALRPERLNLVLVGAFALAALTLAGLGLYGIVNGNVLSRRREIGIRMAVGADPGRVVGMIVGQGMRLVAAGTLLGLVTAWAVGRLLASILYAVEPFDPPTYLATAGVLGALAVLASWLPARRAARIRPLETLAGD